MQKIGIVLPHTYTDQLAYTVIKRCNDLVLEGSGYDCAVFYEDLTPNVMRPFFGLFNAAEIFSYDGVLVGTSLQNAASILNTVKPERKIFYVWDLEFVRDQKDFLWNIQIYQNEDLELVTPSEDYRKELKNYCGRDSKVVEDFNVKELLC